MSRRSIVVTTLALSLLVTASLAFAPPPALIHPQRQQKQQSVLWSSSQAPPPKMNPPLSKKEIQQWLDYVPVYTITDPEGKLVYIKPTNDNEPDDDADNKIFTFYVSRTMADATLSQLKLKTNPKTSDIESMDLKLSAFALGQIWYDLLMAENTDSGEEFRLVANDQDLMGARMLLTMGPEEEEQLMNASSEKEAQEIMDRINDESPKFKSSSFNQIPVFMISQMRMQVGDKGKQEKVAMVPMYLNNQDMVTTWQATGQQVEPSISLMELNEIVGMMGTECAFDFRNVMLIPPVTKDPPAMKTFGQGIRLPEAP